MNVEFEKFIKEKVGEITFYTSSSTGSPKMVVKTYENMYKESLDLYDELKLDKNFEFITTTTPEYLFGFTFHCMFPITFGYKRNPNRINYPEEICIENAVLITTPSFLEVMRKYDIRPIVNPKVIITAGSKLEGKTFKFAQSISDRVIEIYGSTETGVIGYRETPEIKTFKLFRGIKILEVNENSVNISTQYSKESIQFLEDRIIVNEDGIEFVGRSERILKINEKRINAETLEEQFKACKYLEDAFCFEFRNKVALLAVLNDEGKKYVIKNGTLPVKKELKNIALDKFDISLQKIKFTNEIPRTNKGKIDRNTIEKFFDLNLSLPLIIEKQKNFLKLVFLKESDFFKGHFKKSPIVPGVVQLLYAHLFAENIFGYSLKKNEIRRIKFSNIIRPDEVVDLEFEEKEKSVDFIYKNNKKVFSSGNFTKLITLIIIMFLGISSAFAGVFDSKTKSISEFISQIPEISDINCKFSQTKTFKESGLVLKSSGNFEFKKNKSVTFYTNYPVKTVNSYKVDDYTQINSIINAVSSKSYSKLEKEFEFYFEKQKNYWALGLKPKVKSKAYNYIKSIEIEGQNSISKMTIINKDETKTEIIYF